MAGLGEDFQRDIEDIAQITIVPQLLNVICQTTGMGFAAIARVTEDKWITCSAKDDIGFGLKPGDELQIKTTICNEIRESGKAVIIDCVKEDSLFANHHTPAMYGFQSYISVPIIRKHDGSFFGTLCAIDPEPHIVTSVQVTDMFYLFADLISFHLNAIDSVRSIESRLVEEKAFNDVLEKTVEERTQQLKENNETLRKMNKELQSFNYITSHDLQEPLRKIQIIASIIVDKESQHLSEKGKDYFKRMHKAAERMQMLINDLLDYSRINIHERKFENISLKKIIEKVSIDLNDEIINKNAAIKISETADASIIAFQFQQLLYNLMSNSLKFANPQVPLVIDIKSKTGKGSSFTNILLEDNKEYCHISISDNGIGFEQNYSEKIFEPFQRLHEKSQYAGTGIGLAIVKKIVENHDGIISATGKVNKGATFNIYIPA